MPGISVCDCVRTTVEVCANLFEWKFDANGSVVDEYLLGCGTEYSNVL